MSALVRLFRENPVYIKLAYSILFLLLHLIVLRISTSVLFRTIKDNVTYYTTRKRLYHMLSAIYIILLIVIWSGSKLDLTTYVGFISAGIAIALREIFTNIAAWLIIVSQKSFEVGDRVRFNDTCGDVIDLKLFHFIIMEVSSISDGEQSTGRIVHVPNNYIFNHAISNANKGFEYIWHEIHLKMPLHVDHNHATHVLQQVVNKHAKHVVDEAKEKVNEAGKRYQLMYTTLTPIVYLSIVDNALEFHIRYLCEPRRARITENAIIRELLDISKSTGEIQFQITPTT